MIPLNAHVICIILQPLLFKLGRPSSCAPTPQACQWCFQNPRSWYVRPSPCLRTGRSYSQESKMLALQCNAWLAAVLTTIEGQHKSSWCHCQSPVDNHLQLLIFQILAHHHLQHLSLEWRKKVLENYFSINLITVERSSREMRPSPSTSYIWKANLEQRNPRQEECDRSVFKVFPSVFQIHQNGFRMMSKCFPDL